MAKAINNQQINNTSYYQLPSGKFLEDFIWEKGLDFAEGSALKYRWRAGKKDGESSEKDINKAVHYEKFIAAKRGVSAEFVRGMIERLIEEAKSF